MFDELKERIITWYLLRKVKELYEERYWTVKQPVDQLLHMLVGFTVLLPVCLYTDPPLLAAAATGLLSDVRMEWDQYPWHKWFDGYLDLIFYALGGMLCALVI